MTSVWSQLCRKWNPFSSVYKNIIDNMLAVICLLCRVLLVKRQHWTPMFLINYDYVHCTDLHSFSQKHNLPLTSFLTALNRACRASASVEDMLLVVFKALHKVDQMLPCYKHQNSYQSRSLILTFSYHTPPHLLAC